MTAPVRLDEQQRSVQLSLYMVSGATISGRVVSPAGRGIPEVFVRAEVVDNSYGIPAMKRIVGGQTDDRGEYQLFGLPPGEYYIAAQHQTEDTFYPGASTPAQARPVIVGQGQEVRGIDLTVSSR